MCHSETMNSELSRSEDVENVDVGGFRIEDEFTRRSDEGSRWLSGLSGLRKYTFACGLSLSDGSSLIRQRDLLLLLNRSVS